MAVPTFDRAVSAIHLTHEVQTDSPMHALVSRARTTLDEEPEVIYSVEGGHVIQGTSEAIFFGDDGEVSVTDIDEEILDEDIFLLLGGLTTAALTAIIAPLALKAKRTIQELVRLHKDGKESAAEKALNKLSPKDRRQFEALMASQTAQLKRMNARESVDEAKRLSTKDPMGMTAGAINKELDKLDAISSGLTTALIDAGRGREKFSDIAKGTDPLSKDMMAVTRRQDDLRAEAKARYGPKLIGKLPTGKGYGPRKRNEDEEQEGGRDLDEAGIKPVRVIGKPRFVTFDELETMGEEIEDEEGLDLVEHEVLVICDCEDLIAEAIEEADHALIAQHGELIAEFESCVEEGDYERAETLTEMICEALQLDEYKRMTTGARMKRLRSRRTGMTAEVKTGKKSRTQVRKDNRINRRMMKRSPSKRLKQKRYRRRTRHHAARRSTLSQAKESVMHEATEVRLTPADIINMRKVPTHRGELTTAAQRWAVQTYGKGMKATKGKGEITLSSGDHSIAVRAINKTHVTVVDDHGGKKPHTTKHYKLSEALDEGMDTAKRMGIVSPNSSGQGSHPEHAQQPYHSTLVAAGLTYSHTTPVGHGRDDFRLHHTYRLNRNFAVSVYQNKRGGWIYEGGKSGSGRMTQGEGVPKLKKYLGTAVKRHQMEDIDEGLRPGKMFVVVDTSVPGGRMIGDIITGVAKADAKAAKLRDAGKDRVQVLDALWYGPAREKLIASGVIAADESLDEDTNAHGIEFGRAALDAMYDEEDEATRGTFEEWRAANFTPSLEESDDEAFQGYGSLNDAPGLDEGDTEIWFLKPGAGDGPLEETHVLVGTINEQRPESVLRLMQGAQWSPNGEARTLISQLGLNHTSMSVGDVVKVGDTAYSCDRTGFTKLS